MIIIIIIIIITLIIIIIIIIRRALYQWATKAPTKKIMSTLDNGLSVYDSELVIFVSLLLVREKRV